VAHKTKASARQETPCRFTTGRRHRLGKVVAVVEVVSPGNKSGRNALRSFVEKTEEILRQGINLLVVDLFPPSPRDPEGIHKAIGDEICEEPFALPPDKLLTVAAKSLRRIGCVTVAVRRIRCQRAEASLQIVAPLSRAQRRLDPGASFAAPLAPTARKGVHWGRPQYFSRTKVRPLRVAWSSYSPFVDRFGSLILSPVTSL